MTVSRRKLLMALAAVSLGTTLAGCETTKDGDTTTITLDVGKVTRYAQAGLNASSMVISILALNPSFSVFVAPIRSAADVLNNSLTAFTQATGDKVTISYDDTNFKTLVNTLLDDLDRILSIVGGVTVAIMKDNLGLNTSLVNKIVVARDALSTLISIFKVLVGGFISTASGTTASMDEQQALSILNA